MTVLAAGAPAADRPVNESAFQESGPAAAEDSGKVMILKLNSTWAYLNGNMIPTLVYDSGFISRLILVNGTAIVPLRFVCQSLGHEVIYNEETGNPTVMDPENGVKYELITGTTEMYKYDFAGNLLASGTAAAPTIILCGVTHMAARSLPEAMGYYVYWDNQGYVLISENPKTADEFQSLIEDFQIPEQYPLSQLCN